MRNFWVCSHKLAVDILSFTARALPLSDNILAVVENSVGNDGSQASKADTVGESKEAGHVQGTIFFVGSDVQGRFRCEHH